MSRRRLNNPLDLTELEFKEVSNKKLKKISRANKETQPYCCHWQKWCW